MNYTSIEQSKHLLELGLNSNTADMFYPWHIADEEDTFEDGYLLDTPIIGKYGSRGTIPCWSLGALLDVMPKIPRVEFNLVLPGVDGEPPYIAFDDCRENHQVHLNFEGSTPLEAAYNTVCWLLEQGYIKKEV